ncbi:DNA polymerase I [Haloferax sp. Atlit-6N]|uniref:type B DNA-directed DNA polymerase n=1 Tax=Haloferax sp. Atlit-6N TaxID=2077205 RepID=UPI000E275256|nr:type B DNA-directed DNA polymerase [Haloferax sp. Atlit-6N]REA05776.1 DNA polymerase I [Haloferax sp. Atlit-6N]
MWYTFDFIDGDVYRWTPAGDTGTATYDIDSTYRPRFYVRGARETRAAYERALEPHPSVATVKTVERRPGFGESPEPVTMIEATAAEAVPTLARQTNQVALPDELRCYNVDFSPEFRYCLETETDPMPNTRLTTVELSLPRARTADEELSTVTIDGETVSGSQAAVVDAVATRVAECDPDVLFVNAAAVIPRLFAAARDEGHTLELGRGPHAATYQTLAGESTYHSYGQVGHSPARYNVPGRVVINRSASFFLRETNLAGCLDLVERSRKPLQEQAWASIGNVLTAIQIRAAQRRDVLVQWRAWRPESWKTMGSLYTADRGGFTFTPDVGVHTDVHEVDFSSLYPNIIITRNISPETVRCDCCSTADVPELGYSICDRAGYLPDVLDPLVSDRDAIKDRLAETTDPDERARLEGESAALKWILVSCFGYQGFSNAKFGRIECHEAINAFARSILLDAKDQLEAAGWDVVHGLVDSLWVTPASDRNQRPLTEVCRTVTADVGIRLEYEGAFDWVAFVPKRDSTEGALTKYFGKYAEPTAAGSAYKYRGIECRQRSTPSFVGSVQKALIRTFDQYREPGSVIDKLAGHIDALHADRVDPSDLVITTRTSKSLTEYTQATQTVAALQRADGLYDDDQPAGSTVEYVVVDDDKQGHERVALREEAPSTYDAEFYATALIRAATSVLAPCGWTQARIERALAETTETSLARWS